MTTMTIEDCAQYFALQSKISYIEARSASNAIFSSNHGMSAEDVKAYDAQAEAFVACVNGVAS